MIALIGTILCSSVLFLIFRLFPKFKVDTGQAIVFNYFTAFVTGVIVSGEIPSVIGLIDANLLPWTLISGALFIALFLMMGLSSQINGMGTTSVAVKMSLALSAIVFVFMHNESLSYFKIAGFFLAITGVLLISLEKNEQQVQKKGLMLLALLFFGCAGLDIVINVVEVDYIGNYSKSMYTAFGFLAAGTIGIIGLLIQFVRKKSIFHPRNVLAGIILGIPNYFSILFLMKAYSSTGWNDSTVLAVMNISIVALAALLGIIIFKESTKTKKIIGLLAVTAAIYCLTNN